MPAVEVGPIAPFAILGGGTAFPRRTFDNAQVLALTGRARSPEQLRFAAAALAETMGVRERAWAHVPGEPLDHAAEESTVDLAVAAARAALADAGVAPAELALVLCATSTPHRMTTTVAATVGGALGAGAACLDVRGGCAAGIFALTTAALHIAAGAGPVLLVGADTFSKVVPVEHAPSLLALADGAGALVLGARAGAALLAATYETDGALGRLVYTDGALPPTAADVARGGFRLSGAPDEMAAVVPERYARALGAALARAGIAPGDLDLYVPHQTGRAVLDEACARAGIPRARAFDNLARHGNIGAAGWLVALVEARAAGRIAPGARVALASVGGGLAWGAAVLSC
jgi:3-oxoacyl-[acyl-carrier-protein] synthase III